MHGIFFDPPIESNFLGHQMAEIYKDNLYRPFLMGKKELTIIDLGANVGLTSYYFSKFASKVYAIEPASEHFEALTKMIDFNNFKNIIPLKKAISIRNGTTQLFKNQTNMTSYSIDPIVNAHIEKQQWGKKPQETVECITLEKLFKDNEIKHCDFMKMDIEGSEAEILGHTSFRNLAPEIDTIVLESHLWGNRHPNQVKEALKNNGFEVSQIQKELSSELLVARK